MARKSPPKSKSKPAAVGSAKAPKPRSRSKTGRGGGRKTKASRARPKATKADAKADKAYEAFVSALSDLALPPVDPPIAPSLQALEKAVAETTDGKHVSRKASLLQVYVLTAGNLTRACAVCKVQRSTHYYWLDRDARYRAAFAIAERHALGVLEDEGKRRAFEGVHKPLLYKGEIVAYQRVYSDGIWTTLMRAKDPAYRQNGVINERDEKGGVIDVDYQVEQISPLLLQLSNDKLNEIADLIQRSVRATEEAIRAAASGRGTADLPEDPSHS